MITTTILTIAIALISLVAICSHVYFRMRITELEIYGYNARKFIEKCGLIEEWKKVIDGIEKDMRKPTSFDPDTSYKKGDEVSYKGSIMTMGDEES